MMCIHCVFFFEFRDWHAQHGRQFHPLLWDHSPTKFIVLSFCCNLKPLMCFLFWKTNMMSFVYDQYHDCLWKSVWLKYHMFRFIIVFYVHYKVVVPVVKLCFRVFFCSFSVAINFMQKVGRMLFWMCRWGELFVYNTIIWLVSLRCWMDSNKTLMKWMESMAKINCRYSLDLLQKCWQNFISLDVCILCLCFLAGVV